MVGLPVTLSWQRDGRWEVVAQAQTDELGRIATFETVDGAPGLDPGHYRLIFGCRDHLPQPAFYPEVIVSIRLDDPDCGYPMPLVLSPFGYATCLGSAG